MGILVIAFEASPFRRKIVEEGDPGERSRSRGAQRQKRLGKIASGIRAKQPSSPFVACQISSPRRASGKSSSTITLVSIPRAIARSAPLHQLTRPPPAAFLISRLIPSGALAGTKAAASLPRLRRGEARRPPGFEVGQMLEFEH
jgi:hypothetical protein